MAYRKLLGDWGEAHAVKLLRSAKFNDIVPLNAGQQHPGGDVLASKNGNRYFFSVKARDRFGKDRKPNPGYNIYPPKVIRAAKAYDAIPAWLVIRADRRDNTLCSYWGLISEIPSSKKNRSRVYVSMSESAIATYRCLADKVTDRSITTIFHSKPY